MFGLLANCSKAISHLLRASTTTTASTRYIVVLLGPPSSSSFESSSCEMGLVLSVAGLGAPLAGCQSTSYATLAAVPMPTAGKESVKSCSTPNKLTFGMRSEEHTSELQSHSFI